MRIESPENLVYAKRYRVTVCRKTEGKGIDRELFCGRFVRMGLDGKRLVIVFRFAEGGNAEVGWKQIRNITLLEQ